MEINKYFIEKNVSLIKRGHHTNFLDPVEFRTLSNALKKENIKFNVFSSFEDCNSKIIYTTQFPNITLLKLNKKIEHKHILGNLFNLGINKDTFGDIVVNNFTYVLVHNNVLDIVKSSLSYIQDSFVEITEVDILEIENHKINFEYISLNVSSIRIDNVLAKLINTSRSKIDILINDKNVILNYKELTNKTYFLKENDVFSVRKYGKFVYNKIIKTTKKDTYIIELKKYI
ncbi:MAG: YlmH/Sll1252 family protein [Mycoplasmatota bacterium]